MFQKRHIGQETPQKSLRLQGCDSQSQWFFLPNAIFVIATLRFYCDFCGKSLRFRSCDCQSLAIAWVSKVSRDSWCNCHGRRPPAANISRAKTHPKHFLRQKMSWGDFSLAGKVKNVSSFWNKLLLLKPFVLWDKRAFQGKGKAKFKGHDFLELRFSLWGPLWPFLLQREIIASKDVQGRCPGFISEEPHVVLAAHIKQTTSSEAANRLAKAFYQSGKSKRGLSKRGLGPKGANWAKKGPFGAISALPP